MSEPDAPAAETTSGGARKRLLLLLPLFALAGAGGGYVALTQLAPAAPADADTEAPTPAEPIRYGQFLQIDGLIVNPAGTDGSRYLMVTVGLESSSGRVIRELGEKEVVVRDAILTVLGHKTVAELASIGQRDALREELRQAVNAILRHGQVDRLYFTQYVLQ